MLVSGEDLLGHCSRAVQMCPSMGLWDITVQGQGVGLLPEPQLYKEPPARAGGAQGRRAQDLGA
jgi:hypothetical protein